MTVLAGATGMGYAVGSSVAGQLADASGHTAAFGVTVTAGVLATALTLAAAPLLRAEQRRVASPASAEVEALQPA